MKRKKISLYSFDCFNAPKSKVWKYRTAHVDSCLQVDLSTEDIIYLKKLGISGNHICFQIEGNELYFMVTDNKLIVGTTIVEEPW